ncbi:stage V sporulation protein D (sporulation-specific penicillin-binding protein) [Prosthecobacter fusiformis]|uniref:Stage V sporulation protein D (Sporulation-specific penicillin-binding protein) n=1 Tax=Prosthecobacter fusiformis TaxID=48464 RepID=A0A4V3FE20_9BACT|nr:penicillin-binding protein 2 [Prosthecobacter fusiformis]TDU64240.1 stage V sporulation protein D (sporulation-specific penicillin-binding protein) [Prosthecobacter fusiformis]
MMSTPNQTQLRRDRPLCHRMMVVTCGLTVCFSAVVWRLYDLHLKKGPQLAEEASKKFREDRVLPAQRGSIKDHSDRYLAYDEEVYELRTDRVHLHDVRSISPNLARIRGVTQKELTRTMSDEQILKSYHAHVAEALSVKLGGTVDAMLEKVTSKRQIEVLTHNMNDDQAKEWREHLANLFVKGIYVKPAVRRHYPMDNRLALIIGGTEEGKGGVQGIESAFEDTLRGVPGSVCVEHDKYGRELLLYRGDIQEPVHGKDVHLTIDLQMQDAVDAIVAQAQATYRPNKIMAVVTEVATGSVLAMSFLPGHDRNEPGDTNWKNLTIYEPYEPGSTFKVVAFTAALDQRKMGPDERFDCHWGHYTDQVLKVSLKDVSSMGTVTAREAFAKSSNIATYKVFKRVGQDMYLNYVKRFGFGQKTGISLSGESRGYINDGHWSNTTYSRFPMGYEVNVTPLQMAMAYGAIANGGILMKPRLVDRIVTDGGRQITQVPPEAVGQVCTGKTAGLMRDLLKGVVDHGTGTRAQLEGIEVAGKTGTSQRYDHEMIVGKNKDGSLKKGGYRKDQWITSFAGFAPANDPKIVCVVVLDNPHAPDPADIGGGKVAAPIFAEIVAETLKQLSIRPQRPLALKGAAE